MSTGKQWNMIYRQGAAPWGGVPSWLKERVGTIQVSPMTALDLGCGAGEKSIWLAELGYSVTGVDISAAAVRKASEQSSGNPTFIVRDITQIASLNIPHQPYGLILDLLTVQFLDADSQKQLFNYIKTLLADSGALIHSRLEANTNEAPQWVQNLAVSPEGFEELLSDLEVTWHEAVKSKNLPATTVHQYVLQLT